MIYSGGSFSTEYVPAVGHPVVDGIVNSLSIHSFAPVAPGLGLKLWSLRPVVHA